MKPFHSAVGALAIALVFGAGGYWLGKHQPSTNPISQETGDLQSRTEARSNPSREPSAQAIAPKNLRAKLDAETNPLAKFKLAMQNLEAWVATNPQDAMAWLMSQQPSERRDEILRLALNQFAEVDPKGAAAWASKNLSGNDLNNSLIAIAESWAEQNGAEAAGWFLSLGPSQQRDAAIESLFFGWASNEPTAALDFLKTNPNVGDLSPTLQRAVLAGWAKSDPTSAVAASLDISRTNSDPGLFANTLANWATVDLEGSSNWLLANLKTGAERAAAVQELATIFAQQSPDAGIAWIAKLNAGSERDAAASAMAATWARSDPAAAAKWVASQGTFKLAPEAATAIGEDFLRENPAAFEAWRAALPVGPLKTAVSGVKGPEAGGDEED